MNMSDQIGTIMCGILLVTGCGYVVIVVALSLAIGRVRTGRSEDVPLVNVVIAARNEETQITDCLDALRLQDYPPDRYCVIVIDDRSADTTGSILTAYAKEWDALSVITVNHAPEGISPKKYALEQGISNASGEIILQTDADCIVPATWISSTVKRFEPGIDMVAGIAPYRPGNGILARFVAHEYLWNALLSAGSIILGAGTHASGRNIAFRRTTFMEISGYGETRTILSGDDTLLMQRIQRHRTGSIATNPSLDAHVITDPPQTFAVLARQRIRHMSTGRYFHPFQIAAGVIVYGFHATLVLSLVFSPFISTLVFAAFIAFLLKIICDAIAFARTGRLCSLTVNWRFFVAGELLCALYFFLFPILGTILPVSWKENR